MNVPSAMARKADRNIAKARKRETKKRDLAQSAISALKTYGYAQTTLRDIADQSDMSLGMLHYYFDSKEELLIYCVRLYKEQFVSNMQAAIERAPIEDDLARTFAAALVETIEVDSDVHRLWYDIRSQSMFDATFQPVVTELEVMMAGLLRDFCDDPDDDAQTGLLYAQVDGIFRYLLQKKSFGEGLSKASMQTMLEKPLEGRRTD